MKKLFALAVVLVSIVAVFGVWFQYSLLAVDSRDEDRTTVKIEEGSSVDQIASLLFDRGLIRSPSAFKIFAKLIGAEASLQAGSFVMSPSYSAAEVVNILQSGRAEEMILTIPEGFTVRGIDALLTEKHLIQPDDFILCAQNCDLSEFDFLPKQSGLAERGGQVEGYLFPDTYYIEAADFSVEKFLKRLLSTFEVKILEGLSEYIDESGRDLHEIVTMASLVEEEASSGENGERAMISGILWSRFDHSLGLGVDATVRYILDKATGTITLADLNTNDPYNTRKFRGLPPGPIANAGYESILAAVNPQDSEYMYYLHDKNGDIHYAVTNEEHNINRYKYLK